MFELYKMSVVPLCINQCLLLSSTGVILSAPRVLIETTVRRRDSCFAGSGRQNVSNNGSIRALSSTGLNGLFTADVPRHRTRRIAGFEYLLTDTLPIRSITCTDITSTWHAARATAIKQQFGTTYNSTMSGKSNKSIR